MPKEHTPKDKDRAKLHKIKYEKESKDNGSLIKYPEGDLFTVQFNPKSLTVNHQNQISASNQRGQIIGYQIVGKGNRSLSVDLFFDVTHPRESKKDVRELTKEVRKFVVDPKQDQKKEFIPPGIRFCWGAFQFDGMMDSVNESLEFFDPEGHPLRALVSISIQEIEAKPKKQTGNGQGVVSPSGAGNPEKRPQGAQNTNGTSLQQLAGERGKQDNWKNIAAQNGIENPRSIHNPGAVDLSVSAKASVSGSVSA